MIGSSLNQYKNMLVLSGKDTEDLLEQIQQIPYAISIVSMYASGSKHFCWLVCDRKVHIMKKPKARKPVDLENLNKKINKEK